MCKCAHCFFAFCPNACHLLTCHAISAVQGETRRLEQYGVFVVTGIFSIFAYVWLIIILVVSSPNVVEIWEVWCFQTSSILLSVRMCVCVSVCVHAYACVFDSAASCPRALTHICCHSVVTTATAIILQGVVTLLFFPVLLLLSLFADRGLFDCGRSRRRSVCLSVCVCVSVCVRACACVCIVCCLCAHGKRHSPCIGVHPTTMACAQDGTRGKCRAH